MLTDSNAFGLVVPMESLLPDICYDACIRRASA